MFYDDLIRARSAHFTPIVVLLAIAALSPNPTQAQQWRRVGTVDNAALAAGRLCSAKADGDLECPDSNPSVSAGAVSVEGALVADRFEGSGAGLTDIPLSALVLSGTADATTFLRGDGTWAAMAVAASGSTGHVQFNNSGAFASDGAFFWDNTNKRLGIGTAAPSTALSFGGDVARIIGMERGTVGDTAGYSLTVKAGGATNKAGGDLVLSAGTATGSARSKILFQVSPHGGTSGTSDRTPATQVAIATDTAGILGIGTANPANYLSIHANGNANTPLVGLTRASATDNMRISFTPNGALSASNTSWGLGVSASTTEFAFSTWDGTNSFVRMLLSNTGNVGIGTVNPARKLHVAGSGAYIALQDTNASGLTATGALEFIDSASAAQAAVYREATSGSFNLVNFQSAPIKMVINGHNRAIFNSTGLGVGDNVTPLSVLDVKGGVAVGTYAGANVAPSNGVIVSGNVGIGTTAPAASSLLDVVSTTRGFLPPRMTAAQRDAIGSPAAGLTVYNTTSSALNVYNGTAWGAAGSGGSSSGAAGYVQISGGAGAFAHDAAAGGQFFWDSTNHRLGIGTASPIDKLDVAGGIHASSNAVASKASETWMDYLTGGMPGNIGRIGVMGPDASTNAAFAITSYRGDGTGPLTLFHATNAGNVGIGTATPGAILDVASPSSAANATLAQFLQANQPLSGYSYLKLGKALSSYNQADISFLYAGNSSTSNALNFGFWGTSPLMTIRADGNVGIGTTTPGQKLTVAGTVESTAGGFKFPDGTTQTTAASGAPSGTWCGLRKANGCTNATTPIYGAPSIPCGGQTITLTCTYFPAQEGYYPTAAACPSGYTGTAFGVFAMPSSGFDWTCIKN